ncbi:HRDC domain-containing protein [Phytoactinopolyspora limicola]|uniref:HRDC domain-containing protein n=1 Tax=Phytoactinopolyspora limicola TaxID=2715536 RepID=UPI00140B3F90|nr:HRDC domain-containing protein [Phytoactinopolyspora limicola]
MTPQQPVPLTEPRDGLPDVVNSPEGLDLAVAAVAAGHGPVAIDAERASGYRYGHRAYLVQLRRAGTGTILIDPLGSPDLSALGTVLTDVEWVLHAASQDLPCLAEVGMRPSRLFDTELAARLLSLPRVGLAPLVENILGFQLEKGHSAADWSSRPLPESWIRYAALDVELLLELREILERQLRDTGKLEWAHEEFAALAAMPPPEPRSDPWRRTSGLHRIRDRRSLAAVRQLWLARDDLAQRRDLSPGRVLPDAAIIDAAITLPSSAEELAGMPVFRGRAQRREVKRWFGAIDVARQLPDDQLPPQTARYDGPPPARTWVSREPEAAARLAAARTAVAEVAEAHTLPVENLLAPETLRRVTWDPPEPISEDGIAEAFRARGARDWQVRLTAGPVAKALTAP